MFVGEARPPGHFRYRSGVTPDWYVFGNKGCPYASLTGGTQFVTVNQSFTRPLAGAISSASGPWQTGLT
jgi:hypothetical protein